MKYTFLIFIRRGLYKTLRVMKHVVGLQDFSLMLKGTVMNCVFP